MKARRPLLPLLLGASLAGRPAPLRAADAEVAPAKLTLPGDLRLGGRFDVAYERAGFNGDPTAGHDAFRNYNHLIFLSRHVPQESLGFNAELLDRSFYELTFRVKPRELEQPWRLLFRAGKILVPFGSDPLFHHSYGGLTGFDQKFLPVVWAQYGIAAELRVNRGPFGLSNDLYVVQGHRLSAADAVLDLQRDLSPVDQTTIAVGDRIGLACGPVAFWYSAYFNSIGFSRHLFLQAGDLMLWRPPFPVIDRFAIGLGFLRADVYGGESQGVGGSGKDYYHFADYLWVRGYVREWLYLQYRSGIYSYNNRRGFFRDDTRLDEHDSSHHNFTVTAQYQGASVSLGYYLNFEKADEVKDDLLRVLVTYEF